MTPPLSYKAEADVDDALLDEQFAAALARRAARRAADGADDGGGDLDEAAGAGAVDEGARPLEALEVETPAQEIEAISVLEMGGESFLVDSLTLEVNQDGPCSHFPADCCQLCMHG